MERGKVHKVAATDNEDTISQVVKHQQRTDTQEQLRHLRNMTTRDLVLYALLGNTSPRRIHVQSVSGSW